MRNILLYLRDIIFRGIYNLFRIFPLQNKIVTSANGGARYADNPKFIVEALLQMDPNVKVIWLKQGNIDDVPSRINLVDKHNPLRVLYTYATSKVIITTDSFPLFIAKRTGQVLINTWHGGLGIKSMGDDRSVSANFYHRARIKRGNSITDVCISNSNHLSNVYRHSFQYKGPIWKCGYPKNDMLFDNKESYRKIVRKKLGLLDNVKIFLYAPTFRDYKGEDVNDMSYYDVDYKRLHETLTRKFSGEWIILVKYHPSINCTKLPSKFECIAKNVTMYNDMQELIMGSDFLMSDYSSCIFDAATMSLDCILYANDYKKYKEERGVYYGYDELPFDYAFNNNDLITSVLNYDRDNFIKRWQEFAKKMGLRETGHAGRDIAAKILDVLNGKLVEWENTDL